VTDVRNYRLFPESRLLQPVTSGLLPQAWGRPDKSLAHLSDNIGATEVAARLTGDGVRALTAVQDEESATLAAMPAQMANVLGRRRRGSDTADT
jgi:hypothetical protein